MKKFQLFTILLTVLMMVGCGPSVLRTEFVEGIVTLDGEPLADATVTFIPLEHDGDSRAASGFTDETGRYRLTTDGGRPQGGALAGEYRVTVVKVEVTEIDITPLAERREGYSPQLETTQAHVTPTVYNNPAATTLRATVVRGRNVINLEMTSGAR